MTQPEHETIKQPWTDEGPIRWFFRCAHDMFLVPDEPSDFRGPVVWLAVLIAARIVFADALQTGQEPARAFRLAISVYIGLLGATVLSYLGHYAGRALAARRRA